MVGEMSSSSDPWSLEGQTALVTGATKGIGRAIAEELAQLGAHVWICARTKRDLERRLDEYKGATWTKGGAIEGSVCDVSVAEEREELMRRVAARFSSKLDILVNNAADLSTRPALELSAEALSRVMAVNVGAGLELSRLARPLMKANGKGVIVFNSSILGSTVAGMTATAYSASKAAMNQLARDLAFEWAPDNIRVNVVAPGSTATTWVDQVAANMRLSIEDRIPLRRFAEPPEIARVFAFLCMPAASYITGTVITADGGMTIHASPFPCAAPLSSTASSSLIRTDVDRSHLPKS